MSDDKVEATVELAAVTNNGVEKGVGSHHLLREVAPGAPTFIKNVMPTPPSAEHIPEAPAQPKEEILLRYNHPQAAHCFIKDARNGIVKGSPQRKKVAFVGFATTSFKLAPFDDPEYEIWGLNQLYRFIPRADRWFDIHREYNTALAEGTDYIGWLRASQIPIYMCEWQDHISKSVRYPIERMINHFGKDYFTSTIAYMLALAIYEGFETIALYGIDLVVGKEYTEQRPCTEYYIGWACAKGITIEIPESSALCKQRYRYGYQDVPEGPVRVADLIKRRSDIDSEREKTLNKLLQLDGALMDLNYFLQGAELRERGAEWTP